MSQWIRQRRAATFALALTAWILLLGCNSTPDEGASSTVTTSTPQSETRSSDATEKSTQEKTAEVDSSMPTADNESLPVSDAPEAVAKSEAPSPDSATVPNAAPTEPAPASSDPVKQGEPAQVVAATPAEVHVPQVIMSAAQTAECKVKIGDEMPALSLPNLSGEVSEWASLQGEKATVVIFWSGVHRFAREQVQRLPHEILQPFQGQGINVVAVHVGPMADELKESFTQSEFEPARLLIDESGQALTQVATGGVPRTYVLDPAGRIVWLDVEYSRDAARELVNAIQYQLTPPPAKDS